MELATSIYVSVKRKIRQTDQTRHRDTREPTMPTTHDTFNVYSLTYKVVLSATTLLKLDICVSLKGLDAGNKQRFNQLLKDFGFSVSIENGKRGLLNKIRRL